MGYIRVESVDCSKTPVSFQTPLETGLAVMVSHRTHLMSVADSLDDRVNNSLAFLPPKINSGDSPFLLSFLLQNIAFNSDGRLNGDPSFHMGILSDPEKGPSLKEKLAKAWDEKKYQSIRDIGRF